jgi:hypothetical protein
MPWVFSPADFAAMRAAKRAFDPEGRLNPGKIFPQEDAQEDAQGDAQDDAQDGR